jgi:cholesterol 7-dehydrogenase
VTTHQRSGDHQSKEQNCAVFVLFSKLKVSREIIVKDLQNTHCNAVLWFQSMRVEGAQRICSSLTLRWGPTRATVARKKLRLGSSTLPPKNHTNGASPPSSNFGFFTHSTKICLFARCQSFPPAIAEPHPNQISFLLSEPQFEEIFYNPMSLLPNPMSVSGVSKLAICLFVLFVFNFQETCLQFVLAVKDFILRHIWALLKALIFMIPSLLMGLLIDYKVIFTMFFNCQIGNQKDRMKKRLANALNQPDEQSAIVTSSTMNWITGVTCLVTMAKVFFFSDKDTGDLNEVVDLREVLLQVYQGLKYDGSLSSKLCLVLWFGSLTFLVSKFLVDTSYTNNQAPKLNVYILVPAIYHIVCLATVLYLEVSLPIRVATIAISSGFIWALITALYTTRKTGGAAAGVVEPKLKTEYDSSSEKEAEKSQNSLYTRISGPDSINNNPKAVFYIYELSVGVLLFGLVTAVPQVYRLNVSVCIALYYAAGPACLVLNKFLMKSYVPPNGPEDTSLVKFRLASYNPPFPNGWYPLCLSDDLERQAVKYVKILGQHFAVFRGESGEVHALDAHCPHLGANLAIGGVVKGDLLECPFHQWQFGGDGKCVHIPYCENIPHVAKTKAWRICEYYGHVLVWFHADDEEPSYLPPVVEGIAEGKQVHIDDWETEVNMHIQEFAENSTDFMHFQPVHGKMMFPYTEFAIPGVTVNHRPDWNPDPDHPHMAYFYDQANLNFMGNEIPRSDAFAKITFIGPASIVMFTFNTEIGNICLFQSHSPLKAMRQKVRFRWFADKDMPRLLVWYVVGSWITQWKNDLEIWENKVYSNRPALVKGDGPMFKQRNWFKQFYSAGSRKAGGSQLEW